MPRHKQTQTEWEQTMARRAMELIRSELYLALPYLNAPLGALVPCPARQPRRGFATDGARLEYASGWVLELYRKNRRYLPRACLHSVLHCVFRHSWLRAGRDRALWGLACDIAVESVIDGLDAPALVRPVGWLRQKTYAELTQQCKILAAGPIYRALCLVPAEQLEKLSREFLCDSHDLWPKNADSPQAQIMGRRWEQLGRQTQLELQQAGRRAGNSTGAEAMQAQVQAGRSRRTYRDFLRRFAVWREEPRLDPDEFDLGYYTYGLRTYGDLPLVEPLESRESKKIRDFVIVLDTSESTKGELVRNFLRETFTLLHSGDHFFRRCRILVLQCDDRVRDEVWLDDLEALDRYAARFVLHGGGGTDFRPAFTRIGTLRAEGKLTDLQGVLYFTDGKGVYPAKRPGFDTAFLFLDDGTPPPEVPPWAMKLVLEPEEFLPAAPPPAAAWAGLLSEDDEVPDELPQL